MVPRLQPRTLELIAKLVLLCGFTAPGSCRAQPEAAQSGTFPPELVAFTPDGGQPVFAPGAPGQWDEAIRERGWILRDGPSWKLWYTGYRKVPGSSRMLGYATSTDGIHWTRDPHNPLYTDHWVEDMMVVLDNGTYYMFAEGKDDQAQLLTSPDGIHWKRNGQLDIRLADGDPIPPGPYGTPTAWREAGTWYLLYERRDRGIWLATSTDLAVWRNVQDEPVLSPGPAEYDRDAVAVNQVVRYQGRYYAYYHGSARSGPNQGKWCTCVASSTDKLHWTKYAGNPLTPVSENRSSGILVPEGDSFLMYTMHPMVFRYRPTR